VIYPVSAHEIEVFWDGAEGLAVGFPGIDLSLQSALEINLRVTKSGKDSALLHHFLPSREYQYLRIPMGAHQLALIADWGRSPFRITIDLRSEEQIPQGDWNIILAGTSAGSDGSPPLTTFKAARRGDPEQSLHRHRRGEPLPVWAAVQVRLTPSADQLIISPTETIWPRRHSRLSIELPTVVGPGRSAAAVPVGARSRVLAHALREDAHRRVPRLFIRQLAGNRRLDRLDGQYFIFYLMQQRRFLFHQITAPDPDTVVAPVALFSHEILQAYEDAGGDPERVKKWLSGPDKEGNYRDNEYITGFDLSEAVKALDNDEDLHRPGAIVHRMNAAGAQDVTLEIEFPAAALGDEVGVLMLEDGGSSMSVSSADPGGSARVRMFQVARGGLRPRVVDDGEPVLEELLDWVGNNFLRARALASPADSAHLNDRELFARWLASQVPSQISAAGMNFTAFFAAPLGPLPEVGFVNLLAAVPRAHAAVHLIGGFPAFLRQPSVVAAIAAAPYLARPARAEALAAPDAFPAGMGLPEKLAALIDAAGLVPATLDPEQERAAFRILRHNEGLMQSLIDLRISLDAPAATMERTANRLVACLQEETVKNAAESYGQRRQAEQAMALKAHIANRKKGLWTPMREAELLADAVETVATRREKTRLGLSVAPVDRPAPSLNVEQLRAQVKEMLSQARRVLPAEVAPYEEVDFDDLDGEELTYWMRHLQPLVGSPAAETVFTFIMSRLEKWAGVPQEFAQSRAEHRAKLNGQDQARAAAVTFVNRTLWSVRDPRSAQDLRSGPFAAEVADLRLKIRAAMERHGSFLRDPQIEQDLTDYGRILLFHKARRVIDRRIAEAWAVAHQQSQARRLKVRLTAWPRDAAEAWREALNLGAAKIEPPDFDGEPD
jgi:hypothetical protein